MPVNFLIVFALRQYQACYGEDFRVGCPNGSGRTMSLQQVSQEPQRQLARIFLRDKDDRGVVFG